MPDKISNSWDNFKSTYQKYASEFKFDKDKNFIILKKDTQSLEDFLNSISTPTSKFEKNAIIRFIKLCNNYDKLTNWTIAINTSGSSREIPKEYTGFNTVVKLTKRGGPKEGSNRFYKNLFDSTNSLTLLDSTLKPRTSFILNFENISHNTSLWMLTIIVY